MDFRSLGNAANNAVTKRKRKLCARLAQSKFASVCVCVCMCVRLKDIFSANCVLRRNRNKLWAQLTPWMVDAPAAVPPLRGGLYVWISGSEPVSGRGFRVPARKALRKVAWCLSVLLDPEPVCRRRRQATLCGQETCSCLFAFVFVFVFVSHSVHVCACLCMFAFGFRLLLCARALSEQITLPAN